jgi:ribosomal protein S18 acetylase RimI-like enzyme
MQIQQGLPEKHIDAAVEMLLEAFADEFMPILRDEEKARLLLKRVIKRDYMLYAEEEGELLGILGLQCAEGTFLEASLREFFNIFGLFKGLVKAIGFSFLHHSLKEGELYVEFIAVSPTARGKGIGSKLLDAFEEHGRIGEYKMLRLEVVGSNTRAKALYERVGYEVIKSYSIWPVNKLFGWDYDKVHLMEKVV